MPADVIYAAYSAYKFKFKDVPADYSEVYVYSDDIEEIEKRFPKNTKTPNLFALKKDKNMKAITLALIFVDLWNLRGWYAKDFLNAMEKHLASLNALNLPPSASPLSVPHQHDKVIMAQLNKY